MAKKKSPEKAVFKEPLKPAGKVTRRSTRLDGNPAPEVDDDYVDNPSKATKRAKCRYESEAPSSPRADLDVRGDQEADIELVEERKMENTATAKKTEV
jgi:hypothetical protein